MRKTCLSLLIVSIFAFGCASTGALPPKSQLQIREYQTRSYDINDTKTVMKAMLNVLQDDGFIVKNAVMELGLLSAEKSVDIEDKSEAFWAKFWAGKYQAIYKKASIIECTGNVSEYGKQTRVRINFQIKVFDNKGGILEVKQIDDEKYYQEFFSKVDKGIFIQKEKL
jgi:hypothetical protein